MKYAIIVLLISGLGAMAREFKSLRRLYPRQSLTGINPSDIPSQCQSQCSLLVSDTQRCSTDGCLCTNAVRSDLTACLDCFVTISNGDQAVASEVQTISSKYVNNCKTAGLPVSSISAGSSGGASSVGGGADPTQFSSARNSNSSFAQPTPSTIDTDGLISASATFANGISPTDDVPSAGGMSASATFADGVSPTDGVSPPSAGGAGSIGKSGSHARGAAIGRASIDVSLAAIALGAGVLIL